MVTQEFLSEKQVSELTGLALSTLRNWRFQGKPPAYIRVGGGRAIRYSRHEIEAFMEAGRVEPRQADPGPSQAA